MNQPDPNCQDCNGTDRIQSEEYPGLGTAPCGCSDPNARVMIPYQLPNGDVIMADRSATKNAETIPYQLAGGVIVTARRFATDAFPSAAAKPFRSPFNARELAIVAGVLNSYVRIVSAAYRLAPPHTLTTEIEEIQILARMAELAAQEG